MPSTMLKTGLGELKDFFLSRSVSAFLVGGHIRDCLLDVPTRDIDVAVEGDPLSLARELADTFGGAFVVLGQPFQGEGQSRRACHEHSRGVARVVLPSRAQDTPSDEGRLVIDVSGMEGPIYGDLMRRDFTVDAMALALEDWGAPGWDERILDPFGGREDLAQGIIRALRPSVFRDDPARLLRAVRLAAKLGFHIDPHTAELISREALLITSVAGERVRDEFLAILSLDGAKNHLETLDGLGLLCCIIPELGITKGVQQPREHYWDVFGHSVHSVEGVERVANRFTGDPVSGLVPWGGEMGERFAQEVSDGHTRRTILKLGALLHDIAKPQTKMVDSKGRTRFLGHHTLGASMSRAILHRLRLSHRGTGMVCSMVENHLRPMQMSQDGELPTPRAVYRYFKDVGDVAVDTLYLSLADHLAARGPELDMRGWQRHIRIIEHVLEVGTSRQAIITKVPRLLTGHDLIDEFALAPGPLIGSLLEGVQEAQAAGEITSRDSALAWVRQRLGLASGPSLDPPISPLSQRGQGGISKEEYESH